MLPDLVQPVVSDHKCDKYNRENVAIISDGAQPALFMVILRNMKKTVTGLLAVLGSGSTASQHEVGGRLPLQRYVIRVVSRKRMNLHRLTEAGDTIRCKNAGIENFGIVDVTEKERISSRSHVVRQAPLHSLLENIFDCRALIAR